VLTASHFKKILKKYFLKFFFVFVSPFPFPSPTCLPAPSLRGTHQTRLGTADEMKSTMQLIVLVAMLASVSAASTFSANTATDTNRGSYTATGAS